MLHLIFRPLGLVCKRTDFKKILPLVWLRCNLPCYALKPSSWGNEAECALDFRMLFFFPPLPHQRTWKTPTTQFDHVQHIRAVCPYIHVCRFYWGFYMWMWLMCLWRKLCPSTVSCSLRILNDSEAGGTMIVSKHNQLMNTALILQKNRIFNNTAVRTWKLVVTALLECMQWGPVIYWNVCASLHRFITSAVSVHERSVVVKCLSIRDIANS